MRIALQNFTGGEISPTLSARYDLSRYRNCVACMENMLPGLHGDVARRPGTRFLAELEAYSVLLPFTFSAHPSQNFLLVFGEKTLRVATVAGFTTAPAMATPYAAEDLLSLCHAQVGDVVYLAHQKYPLHKIVRRDAADGNYTWSLEQVKLNTSLPAPAAPTLAFTGSSGSYTLRYKVAAVDANGRQSLASPAGECTGARHPSDWVVGNSTTINWPAIQDAAEYNVYREEAGYFGFIGVASGTSFSDQNYKADITDTPREDWNPFADNNNPGVVAFHQQRMVLAATPGTPQAFYMSRTGDFESFRKSRPLQDDDPVEYLIASGSIDSVTWVASFGDLLVGTSGSEYKASGGDGSAITPQKVSITAQSYWGSAGLAPIIIGNSVLHVQRHGSRVRDLFYSLEKDGYSGNDLSILAPHLFEGHTIKQWAYQQTPGSTIWCVRDDGLLLAFTYMKEHDIWGWSRHVTDGEVISAATVADQGGDALALVVRRTIAGRTRYFLERLAPLWSDSQPIAEAYFVDCGLGIRTDTPASTVEGLDHLEGCALSVLADGSPVEGCVVRNGRIELPYAASVVQAGLPYASVLSPLPVEGDFNSGTTLAQGRAYGSCSLRLYRSVGGQYGPSRNELYDLPFMPEHWGEAVQPFSGDITCAPSGGWDNQTSIWLVQRRPLPFRLLALTLDITFA